MWALVYRLKPTQYNIKVACRSSYPQDEELSSIESGLIVDYIRFHAIRVSGRPVETVKELKWGRSELKEYSYTLSISVELAVATFNDKRDFLLFKLKHPDIVDQCRIVEL